MLLNQRLSSYTGFHSQFVIVETGPRVPWVHPYSLGPTEGCEWAPKCAACPFEDCKASIQNMTYGTARAKAEVKRTRAGTRAWKKLKAFQLLKWGVPQTVVAQRVGVTDRTIRTWCDEAGDIPRHQSNQSRRYLSHASQAAGQLSEASDNREPESRATARRG